jgi:hypothetical protein
MFELGINEIIIFFVVGVVLIVAIFFLVTQQNVLKAIQPQNRTMSPGEVWLQLIPLFNFVWQFIVVSRISESISRELSSNTFSFEETQPTQLYHKGNRPTYQIGMAMCILNLCAVIPVLATPASFACLICFIIYWVQLASFKNQIISKNYSVTPPAP